MSLLLRRDALVLGALTLLGGRQALAHHGWGGYEAGSPVEATGTVERASFENPHATMWLATDAKVWEVVLAPPSRMRARGVEPSMIEAGRTLTAYGYPHRGRPEEMRAEWIRVAGTTYQLR